MRGFPFFLFNDINSKKKAMEAEKPMVSADEVSGRTSEAEKHTCTDCKKAAENDEMAFAFLLALMPVVTLTLFGNMGLL